MKKTTLLSFIIIFIFMLNTLSVISTGINTSELQNQSYQTLESIMYPKNTIMDHIPYQPQEKPEFLSMQQTSSTNAPNGNVIVVHIKRVRIMDESMNDPEYYINIIVDGENSVGQHNTITEREAWFEWPMGYRVFSEYEEKPLIIEIEVIIDNKLWFDTPADISPGDERTLTLTYDPKRGDWSGGDYFGDPSGYGHASGFEDGNYNEKDVEIWFEIYQLEVYNNYYLDGDTLTYWEETNLYDSDPFIPDADHDFDDDGIPSYWEDRYGYDPFSWDDHYNLDPDDDGLQNIEEFQTDDWCSHPFVKDIFIEVDFMEGKYFWNQPYAFTEDSAYLLENAFAKRDIIIHIDLGMYGGGGEYAPFQERTEGMDLQGARLKYFLHGNPNHWRRGIFHWAFVCSKIEIFWGREVGGRMFHTDSFVLARQTIIDNTFKYIYMKFSNPTVGMASVFMHELGHTLGLHNFGGIDNIDCTKPWKLDFYRYRAYESCMNYHYTYKLIDYSDGDDAEYDQNDWAIIDLSRFEN
jgi:hypothetical protein